MTLSWDCASAALDDPGEEVGRSLTSDLGFDESMLKLEAPHALFGQKSYIRLWLVASFWNWWRRHQNEERGAL